MPEDTKASLLTDQHSPVKGHRRKKQISADQSGRTGEVGGSKGKSGKGAGTKSGGISGGKATKSPLRGRGKNDPEGKGSGNR